MKNHYKNLGVLLAACVALPAWAQQEKADSTLTREMLIEKEYNPIVRDADKITRMPEVESPQTNKTKIEYSDPDMNVRTGKEIATLQAGAVKTEYPFSKKRGYLQFGGGNYLNLDGAAGFRFLDTEKDILGIELNHQSTNGTLDYTNKADGETKMKLNDNFGKLYYTHRFEHFQLKTNFSYGHSDFNYYGAVSRMDNLSWIVCPPVKHENQAQQRINFDLSATTLYDSKWNYKTKFGFTSFWQEMPDLLENNISFNLGISKQTATDWRFAFDLDANLLFYSGESDKYGWVTQNTFKEAGIISLQPYMEYKGSSSLTNVKLGIHTDVAYGVSPYFGIAPDIRFNWEMSEKWFLYTDLTGGIRQNSLDQMTRENRYYYMLSQVKNSYTVSDLRLGIRSNAVAGFWFDLYGAMAYTIDERFEYSLINGYFTEEGSRGMNQIQSFSTDAFRWNIGFKMKYQYADILKLGLKIQKNGWNLKDGIIASYKPGFEGGIDIQLRPVKRLIFDINYQILADRKANVINDVHVENKDVSEIIVPATWAEFSPVEKLEDIHQLNAKASWLFNETFSVYGSLNNLMFRKQDLLYGMPNQGFNFMVGGAIRF